MAWLRGERGGDRRTRLRQRESIEALGRGRHRVQTPTHASLIEASVAAGRPIFVEKPLTFTLEESIAIDLVERTGAILQLGFQRPRRRLPRGAAPGRERRARHGVPGPPHRARQRPPSEAYIASSGGLFRDSSVHDFDAIRFVTGREVERVVAVGSGPRVGRLREARRRRHGRGDPDHGRRDARCPVPDPPQPARLRHPDGGRRIRDAVSVGVGPRMPSQSLEAGAPIATDGWEGFLTRFVGAYRAELEAFLDVARGRAPSRCTARDGSRQCAWPLPRRRAPARRDR